MAFISTPKTRSSGILFAGLALLSSLGAFSTAFSATTPIDGFNPNPNGTVNVVLTQPDGKILMGGYFTNLSPYGSPTVAANFVARLNHDGTPDSGFTASANGIVRAMALETNGQILLGGTFTAMAGTGSTSATTRNYIARLNADGTLDANFNPNANGVVYAVATQSDGKVLIGGAFTAVGGTTRNHIARLNADGSLDTTFDPSADKTVLALAVQANGQIIVGGGFASFSPNGSSSTIARSCAARLNVDGSVDTSFDPEPNASVLAILILPNGQIVLGGQFVTVQPNGSSTSYQADFVARLNTDGSLDTNYIINPLSYVSALALQPDGKLIVGGIFTSIFPITALSSSAISYVARINPDGTLDSTFVPQPNQAVNSIAVQTDGNVILGGFFTGLSPLDSSTSVTRNYVARVSTYGVPDATFAPDSAGTVFASAPLSNGQFLIGGTFLSVGGLSQSFFARLNADGSLDSSFKPTFNGPVQAIQIQSDGKYLVGGSFSEVDGFVRNYMVRLNTDGTLDGAFNPDPNANITTIAIQSDNKILISGGFSAVTPNGSTGSYAVNFFCRLNADGSLDTTFNPSPSGAIYAMAFQSDGKIVVVGGFTSISGVGRSYAARILPSGAIDPNPFDPEPNAPVYAVQVQTDGKILIGGTFTGVIPQTGKTGTSTTATIGGYQITVPAAGTSATVPIYINHLARLNTDGTLDLTFFPDPSSDVLALSLQSDGNLLVGGTFTSFAVNGATTGVLRGRIGRVKTDGTLDTSFNPNANDLVNQLTLLSNGNILATGSFTTLQPTGASSPTFANHVAIITAAGAVLPTFSAGATTVANGQVNAIVVQPNGQFVVAGQFAALGGGPGANVARFNPDATPDTTYNAAIDGPVNAIAVEPLGAATQTPSNSGVWLEPNGSVRHSYAASTSGEVVCSAQQPDGKVIVGGLFSDFGGVSTAQNLVRLNLDGTVDTTFKPTPNALVSAIIIQADGKIVIGGGFTTINGTDNAYLARLNSDGTLDTSYAPEPNLQILSLALLPNGQILAGGDFTMLTPTGATTTAAFNFMARINVDGTIDKAFNPDLNSPVYAINVLAGGKILIGGAFTTETPNAGTTIYDVNYLARLNADGTPDTTFYPQPNAPVSSILVQSDGKYVVGGDFGNFEQNEGVTGATVGPIVAVNYLARLNNDATVDTTYKPTPNSAITFLALEPNGQVVAAGAFSTVQPNQTGFPANRFHIARINTDGTLDPSFDPGLNGTVDTVDILADGSLFVGGDFTAVQVGGAVLIGGNFNTIQGNPSANLGRLNSDGTFDSSFVGHPNGPVYALTPRSDGKTLVGGAFTSIDGTTVSNLARLNVDGTIDATFSTSTNGTVEAAALQQDGEIIIGGTFTSVGGLGTAYVTRLEPSGTPEASFAPSINGPVYAVAIQANGQIILGGSFTSVDGQPEANIARINVDGTLDTSFSPNPNGVVRAVTVQVDGGLYVAGSFTKIAGQSLSYSARLLTSGTADTSFTPSTNGPVYAVAVQADGKVILGGAFTAADSLARSDIARFAAPTPVVETFGASTDQSTLSWTRTGSAPSFSNVLFEESLDGATWKTVGTGTTTDGMTWILSGLAPTGATVFYVRTTGIVPSSENSSSGLVQSLFLSNSQATSVVNSAAIAAGTAGSAFNFTVTATQSPKTFSASGLPTGLTINPTTGVISGTPAAAGTYAVTVTVGNNGGTTVSTLMITVASQGSTRFTGTGTSSANRLVNLSSRAELSGGQVLITGFVVSGTGSKPVVLRAVGPGLSTFGVSNLMANPEIQVYDQNSTLVADNKNWAGAASLVSAFRAVGAFALPANSADAALTLSLTPGAYTMHVLDQGGKGGIVLAEIYDASLSPLTAAQRLINISARGFVSPGAGALIGGFVITGPTTKTVLVRGVGPGLSAYNVNDAISDPVLSVFDFNGNLVAQNFAWSNQDVAGADQPSITAADITATDTTVGAFALSAPSPDTALIASLPPGQYTFQVTSASGTTGEALGEVYEMP
ncbi:MAG TPA: putative Ig domain-containing protein [Opitutaceae bacterium]|nr:putative Ig domain-containing protein [Opitutaceae bacterium]